MAGWTAPRGPLHLPTRLHDVVYVRLIAEEVRLLRLDGCRRLSAMSLSLTGLRWWPLLFLADDPHLDAVTALRVVAPLALLLAAGGCRGSSCVALDC